MSLNKEKLAVKVDESKVKLNSSQNKILKKKFFQMSKNYI